MPNNGSEAQVLKKSVTKTSGVYIILQHSQNRVVYVGSSNHIEIRRSSHMSALESGRHHNPHLQNLWNKYGSEDFSIIIIEKIGVQH